MTATKSKPRAKRSKSSPAKTKKVGTLVAFLLDRSGSMNSCKDETITGFNAYISGLTDPKMKFTLTQFDSQGIDIIHNAVPLSKVECLTQKSYVPRGSTPLFDAIGKTVRATEQEAKDAWARMWQEDAV